MNTILLSPRQSEELGSIDETPSLLHKATRNSTRHVNGGKSNKLYLSIFAATVGLSILIVILWMRQTSSSGLGVADPPQSTIHCGETAEEARLQGCVFDVMSFSWLPYECFDAELNAQFLALEDWHWFDSDEQSEVFYETVKRGENEYLYVNWNYHQFHCTYMWRKLHRAILKQQPVDEYIGNYSHTEHCERVLTKGCDRDGQVTMIKRKFIECKVTI
jgi:hypothetical protein